VGFDRCKVKKVAQISNDRAFNRLDWLGSVRMLVMTFIAFGYATTMPRGPGSDEYLHTFGYDPSWYGISVIFMISGFLALRSLHRHGSSLKFLGSRIGRNLPILAIFAALVILVLFPLFGVPPDAGTSRLEQHFAYFTKVVSCFKPDELTPGLLDGALYVCVIQGGLWTLRWGLIAFVVTAVLWALGALRNPRILAVMSFGLTMVYAALLGYGINNPTPALEFLATGLRLGWPFMLGMCLFVYQGKLPRSGLIPAGFIGLAALQYYLLPWTPFIEISAVLGFSYLTFMAMTNKAETPEWLKKLPDLSLGLFVFNWPMSQIVLLLVPTLMPYSLFALSFPPTVILSAICWALISKNTNAKIARLVAA